MLLVLGASGGMSCARPTLDGAFEGTADCEASGNHTVSALFDEQADGELEGHLFIEDLPFFVGTVTARADIDDGEYDAGDNEYAFDLQTDDDDAPEFSVTLEIDADDPDDVAGDVDQFDDDGAVAQTCELELSRISRTDN